MSLNQSQDPLSRSGGGENAPGAFLRALLLGVFALPLAGLVQPDPALAQWDSVAGAVAGAMVRGMVGGGGGYYSGGGGRYHRGGRSRGHVAHTHAARTHVATPRAAPAHHASGGGHHTASSSAPSGPGGGSFH